MNSYLCKIEWKKKTGTNQRKHDKKKLQLQKKKTVARFATAQIMPWTDIALCSALQPTDKCTLKTFFSAKKKTQTFFYLFNSIPDKYCIILELNRSLLYLQKANSPASKPTNQPANKYANHINTVKCRFSKTAALIFACLKNW